MNPTPDTPAGDPWGLAVDGYLGLHADGATEEELAEYKQRAIQLVPKPETPAEFAMQAKAWARLIAATTQAPPSGLVVVGDDVTEIGGDRNGS